MQGDSPSFQIFKQDHIHILRDDLLAGGSKRRALDILVKQSAHTNFYYAGTVMGHGALALAHACMNNGKTARIHLCGTEENAIVQKLQETNAIITLKEPMPIATLHEAMASKAADGRIFPPGFDTPDFEDSMAIALQSFDTSPYSEIWACSVTGTLARALRRAFPSKILKIVSVVKSGAGDFYAPEKYHQAAKNPPPYPSCPHTDAKIWQFARNHAASGALLWNTAG